MRVADSKYSLLHEKTQTPIHRLATVVFYEGKMEQRLINGSRDALGYMDALHAKSLKSQNIFTNSFLVVSHRLFIGYTTYSRRSSMQFLSPSTTPGMKH